MRSIEAQQRDRKLERDIKELQDIRRFFTTGVGAPQFTPDRRAIYIRQEGGTDTTLYVYEGTEWIAK